MPLSKLQQVRSAIVNRHTYLQTYLHLIYLTIKLSTVHNACVRSFPLVKDGDLTLIFHIPLIFCYFLHSLCSCCAPHRVTKYVTSGTCAASFNPCYTYCVLFSSNVYLSLLTKSYYYIKCALSSLQYKRSKVWKRRTVIIPYQFSEFPPGKAQLATPRDHVFLWYTRTTN